MQESDDSKGKTQERRRVYGDTQRPLHALGFRHRDPRGDADQECTSQKAIEHTSDDSIVYLVGKQVAVYSYETQTHRFMPTTQRTTEVLCFAVSFNKRYIALSERLLEDKTNELSSQVSVYNFGTVSRIRTLSLSFLNKASPVTSMDFSRDNKYLIGVTQAPDPYINLWQLDKSKLMGFTELLVRVTDITISPWAHFAMCSTGPDGLRMWRYQDRQLRNMDPIPKRNANDWHFTCHCWFDDDRVCAGTREGDLIVIDNCELKRVIPGVFSSMGAAIGVPGFRPGTSEIRTDEAPTKQLSGGTSQADGGSDDGGIEVPSFYKVVSIRSTGRGVAIGGEEGLLALYERTYDSDHFQCYKRFPTPHRATIIDISVSPNEESMICCYADNELSLFSLANVDILDHERPEEVQQAFKLLPIGFHCDSVSAVDVCIQKSIVVTASVDKQIRIWNFVKKKMEIRMQFQEEALSVSVHPSGIWLLVGFKYKLCMFSVLLDTLHLCQEFPIKQCREVRFSNGGQFFAAAVVNRIFIFHAYSYEPVGHLTGHSSVVKSFCWSSNDQMIISAGFEGTIYEWKVETCKRNESCEYTCKAMSYTAVCYDDVNQLAVTVGTHKVAEGGFREGDMTLRVVKLTDAACMEPPRSTARLGSAAVKSSHNRAQSRELAISPHAGALFVGTTSGELQIFAWPPIQGNALPEMVLELHLDEVLFVQLSKDERFLLTVGDDGCMFVFDVDVLLEGRVPPRRSFNYSLFDDIALVLTHDLDDKARENASLQAALTDEQRSRKHEKETTLVHFTKTLDQTMRASEGTISDVKRQRDEAVLNQRNSETRMHNEFQLIEQQRMKDIQEVEALSSRRAKEQSLKYEALMEEKNDLIVRYENKVYKLQKEQEEDRQKAEQLSTGMISNLERELDRLQKEKRCGMEEAAAVLRDTEQEHEEEISAKEKKSKSDLETKEQERVRTQSDLDAFRRKQEKHDQHLKDLERDLLEERDRLKRKDAKIGDLEKAIQALRLEINVRNDTISASEKKILELKKQTAELEKLRYAKHYMRLYVLTFKFNELRKEVVPKEDSIRTMNDKIEQMDAELERVGIDRDTMSQILDARDEKINVIIKDMGVQNRSLDDKHRLFKLLLRDLSSLLADTEPRRVPYKLRDIIDRYAEKSSKKGDTIEGQSMIGFERQRIYMEAQLAASRKQNVRRESHMKLDEQRKTEENALLVKEINDLRHEKKVLNQKVQVLDTLQKDQRHARSGSVTTSYLRGGSKMGAKSPLADATSYNSSPRRCLTPLGLSGGGEESRGAKNSIGKVHKGTTRTIRDLSNLDPIKVADMIQQLEVSNGEMEKQQREILRLRDFVQHLLKKLQASESSEDPQHNAHKELEGNSLMLKTKDPLPNL